MPDAEYGRKITAAQAEPIIDCRRNFALTQSVIHKEIYDRLSDGSFKTYCQNGYNCFVFHKDLITRFFPPNGSAEYLMVILGAHDKQDGIFESGMPTVITAGCKLTGTKVTGEKEYESIEEEFPANEHPPGTGIVDFPPPGTRGKIVFTVK